jgi:hypothetical protein
MPNDSAAARIDAFLAVPLFNAVYEHFKGQTLPPETGLKNLFDQKYKIVKDRIGPAVRVFYESAEQAGFFSLSGDRTKLIKPVIGGSTAPQTQSTSEGKEDRLTHDKPRVGGGGGASVDGTSLGIHPAIIGLLRELPPAGQAWPKAKKDRFIKAFQTTVDFIYPEDETENSASQT